MTRTGILFMQSSEFFGADSQIHLSVMKHLPRDRFEVHCATPRAQRGEVAPSSERVATVEDIRIRETDFGPTLWGVSRGRALTALLRRALPTLVSLVGLVWYVRRHRIRVVHCTEKPRDAVLGLVVARLGGAKHVVHMHVKAAPWIRGAVRRSIRHADAVIGISEFVTASVREMFGDDMPVFTVLNGLEVQDWEATEVDVEPLRSEFGIAQDAPVVVSASRLFRWKGQHHLIEALPAVRAAGFDDLRLMIVGSDDERAAPGDGSLSEQLRQRAAELGVADHVIFTGWRSDVRELIRLGDVYAMPSFEEPFGMVFVEAMYLERPVVAQDNGGTREVVEHGISGLLSADGDVEQLAADLVRLLGDPDLREQMGRAGRERVTSHLNATRMAVEAGAVYEAVAGAPA